ncbi:putative guanine nucleotide binding protein (G-protein), alpha subunit [Helianthus debilis subsp. tardiflorus]
MFIILFTIAKHCLFRSCLLFHGLLEFIRNLRGLEVLICRGENVGSNRVSSTSSTPTKSPVGEDKNSGEVCRLFDVGGQGNERKRIHLFEGARAVIVCVAISE